MSKKKSSPQSPFEKIQKAYGLRQPEQIQLKIMWHHIKAIVVQLYGATDVTQTQLRKFDQHWEVCEKEKNNTGGKIN